MYLNHLFDRLSGATLSHCLNALFFLLAYVIVSLYVCPYSLSLYMQFWRHQKKQQTCDHRCCVLMMRCKKRWIAPRDDDVMVSSLNWRPFLLSYINNILLSLRPKKNEPRYLFLSPVKNDETTYIYKYMWLLFDVMSILLRYVRLLRFTICLSHLKEHPLF